MAKPKKPKMLKLPKKPKSRTVASMESYIKRKAEVEKENKRKMAQWKKDCAKWESLNKRL